MYIPITKNFTIKVCGRKKSPLFLYFTILVAAVGYEQSLLRLQQREEKGFFLQTFAR